MKQVTIYNYREFDEAIWVQKYAKECGIKVITCPDAPAVANVVLTKGSRCVIVVTSLVTREILKAWKENGVSFVATRTIGYDHIDVSAAKEYGIGVANAPYGPDGVAEYTIMLILMSIRNMKQIMQRTQIQDYTLRGLLGRELKDCTVGIIGTGRIGKSVIEKLQGFGCKILAYDIFQSDAIEHMATYAELATIWKEADIISFHTPLTEDNYHMLNLETVDQMKEGVILINTARGSLLDTKALLYGLRQKKIGAAALDVVEDEFGLYYYDHKGEILENESLGVLRSFPNVTVSHHMAFYTSNAIETMVRDSLLACHAHMEGRENKWQVSN